MGTTIPIDVTKYPSTPLFFTHWIDANANFTSRPLMTAQQDLEIDRLSLRMTLSGTPAGGCKLWKVPPGENLGGSNKVQVTAAEKVLTSAGGIVDETDTDIALSTVANSRFIPRGWTLWLEESTSVTGGSDFVFTICLRNYVVGTS